MTTALEAKIARRIDPIFDKVEQDFNPRSAAARRTPPRGPNAGAPTVRRTRSPRRRRDRPGNFAPAPTIDRRPTDSPRRRRAPTDALAVASPRPVQGFTLRPSPRRRRDPSKKSRCVSRRGVAATGDLRDVERALRRHVHVGAGKLGLALVVPSLQAARDATGQTFRVIDTPKDPNWAPLLASEGDFTVTLEVNGDRVCVLKLATTPAAVASAGDAPCLVVSDDEATLAAAVASATTLSCSLGPYARRRPRRGSSFDESRRRRGRDVDRPRRARRGAAAATLDRPLTNRGDAAVARRLRRVRVGARGRDTGSSSDESRRRRGYASSATKARRGAAAATRVVFRSIAAAPRPRIVRVGTQVDGADDDAAGRPLRRRGADALRV